MDKVQIRELALANGFKLKQQPDGTMELNPYVYEFAAALAASVARDAYIRGVQSVCNFEFETNLEIVHGGSANAYAKHIRQGGAA